MGDDGEEVVPQIWAGVPSPPYIVYVRDNPWPVLEQPLQKSVSYGFEASGIHSSVTGSMLPYLRRKYRIP